MLTPDDKRVIEEIASLSSNDLEEQIRAISHSAWNGQLEMLTLNSWLGNFTGEFFENKTAEQNLALWLALHFVFYTDQDIRSLSRNLWWKFVHQKMEEYSSSGFMKDKTLDEKYQYIIENTRICPLGNCGGSGTNVCYFFRQSNGLKKEMFGLNGDKFEYLILVDDATVSGHQAMECLEDYKLISCESKYVLNYISTVKAKEYIGDSACLISSIELDDKSKCFDENSYVFSRHKSWISVAKRMCKYYGEKLDPRNPLGYRRGQYAFGFYYNIPNNSLPIFWGTLGGWVPLFNRYFSDHDAMGDLFDEKFC